MTHTITILYTQNIRGAFGLLPRLSTLIRRLRRAAAGEVLLLDMGNSCADSVPLCAQTQGRAVLILLDAMTYDAANVAAFLTAQARAKLVDNYLHLTPVDAAHPFETASGLVYAAKPTTAGTRTLHLSFETKPETHLIPEESGGFVYTLHLRTLQAGQVGRAMLLMDEDEIELIEFGIHELGRQVLPDPTIAGTLDFVRAEARTYQRSSGNGRDQQDE